MSDNEQLPVTIQMKKEDGEFIVVGKLGQMKLEEFLKNMNEGDKVEVTYEPIHGNTSYAQLSKLHKCIRIVAAETGHSFEDVKDEVKKKAGLYSTTKRLKSFSETSKEETSQAIQAVIEIATGLSINIENY